ncbi:hypothetical protein [Epilithonimonas xixisoli]|uniref:Uncharacterized protein n=1 Tax=Epilithonimonas xixisoli TaxID=1476462 RepID=A0A4R8I9M7_9FLAO|nr:hypothetical protein [Epilithonimonas xixisoli]TDX86210.1 hypothetical protein B0I22_0320 [Epilithonimonas xixisoli]
MSNEKYVFTVRPQEGMHGEWRTEDGFKCWTDNRASAVRWYKKYLTQK